MSFLDVANSDAGAGAGGAGTYDKKSLQSQVFEFTTSVTKFGKLTSYLGTKRDTHEHRIKLSALGNSLKEVAKDISEAFKDTAQNSGVKQSKLLHDFQQVLKEFQRVNRTCAEKMSATMPQNTQPRKQRRTKHTSGMPSDSQFNSEEGQELLEAEKMEGQLVLDNQIEYHDVLIEERDKGIREIQGQISEVNDIFQDLAVLVNEQGEMIDDIEANIVSTHGNTEQAGRELNKASKNQKSARNRLCIGAIVLLVVLIILMIILQ